jgi:hypothetical protein
MRIQGNLTDDQVRAFKAAGLTIYYKKPNYQNVIVFPVRAANSENLRRA